MDQYLILAYSLAVLTYYFGVLIYVLPIPWWGIKKWAPTLIYDAFVVSVLVFSFTAIIEAINYLGGILNIDWQAYFNWIGNRIAMLGSFITFIITLSLIASHIGAKALSSAVLGPIASISTYTLIVLEIFFILGLIFKEYFSKILIFGILLYAIPFRIARSAGATLIAMSIIFTIALPLLPAFVNVLSVKNNYEEINEIIANEQKEYEKYGIVFVKGKIKDKLGNPIDGILTKWYIESQHKLIATYYTFNEGIFDAGRPNGGLPYNTRLKVELEFPGFIVNPTPSEIYPPTDFAYNPFQDPYAEYFIELQANNVVVLDQYFYFRISDTCDLSIDKEKNTISMIVKPEKTINIEFIFQKTYDIISLSINNTEYLLRTHNITWNDVEYGVFSISLDRGIWYLTISYTPNETITPSLKNRGYSSLFTSNSANYENLGKVAARIAFEWIILPVTYLSILIMITYSLAYTIGGRRVKLPIKEYV